MVEHQHNRAPRYALSSVRAEIDGDAVMIVDVSPTGLLISGASASLERGDAVTVRLSVPLMQKVVPLGVDGFVVRSDDRGPWQSC